MTHINDKTCFCPNARLSKRFIDCGRTEKDFKCDMCVDVCEMRSVCEGAGCWVFRMIRFPQDRLSGWWVRVTWHWDGSWTQGYMDDRWTSPKEAGGRITCETPAIFSSLNFSHEDSYLYFVSTIDAFSNPFQWTLLVKLAFIFLGGFHRKLCIV